MYAWNRPKATHIYTMSVTLCFKFVEDFSRDAILPMRQALILTYILEPVYKMVWRCGGTYLWIYWRIKEMDIENFFLPI
jgi:hypothetical protein